MTRRGLCTTMLATALSALAMTASAGAGTDPTTTATNKGVTLTGPTSSRVGQPTTYTATCGGGAPCPYGEFRAFGGVINRLGCQIIAQHPRTAVVVLTSFSDQPRITGALEAGACGYLLKDIDAQQVAEGIRAAARGQSPLDPRVARAVLDARSTPDPLAKLSEREQDVLRLLTEGLPNKLIAQKLQISEKTVKTHLTRIYRALDVTDRTQAALWAERHHT